MPWARKHDKCVKCGTTETQHQARGLCTRCYEVDIGLRHKTRKRRFRRRIKFAIQSLDSLALEYWGRKMSLGDLAKKYNCTRQYVYKLLKQHGVPRRDKSSARTLAITEGKCSFTRTDEIGNESQVVLQKININKNFFKVWSREMAYVLGVIFTDGNIIPGRERDSKYKNPGSRLSIAQKEPELLEKVLSLMGCDAKISLGKQSLTGNPIHHFSIASEELYDDLLNLGLTPRKSRTMQFPKMPEPCVRQFIRGCWDGDGSVYLERVRYPRASYITGSPQFAEEMIRQLVNLGLPRARLHSHQTGHSFYFRFGTVAACTRLYHVFYDEVPNSMYLSRKFDRFRAIAVDHESVLADEVIPTLNQWTEPVDPIPVESRDWTPETAAQNPTRDVAGPKPFIPPSKTLTAPREKAVLAFPEPFTRTTLAELLAISPRHVDRIMQSRPIVANIYKLSRSKDVSSKNFNDGVRDLRGQVNKFLYGWD